jgi:hypothetical protein
MEQLKTEVSGPQGKFEVSTVQTFAGGAPEIGLWGTPFTTADYADDTPWPYETMVFRPGSSRGWYHEPHASEQQAKDGHAWVISHIKAGTLPLGSGVQGDFGNPSMTPDEWRDRHCTPTR